MALKIRWGGTLKFKILPKLGFLGTNEGEIWHGRAYHMFALASQISAYQWLGMGIGAPKNSKSCQVCGFLPQKGDVMYWSTWNLVRKSRMMVGSSMPNFTWTGPGVQHGTPKLFLIQILDIMFTPYKRMQWAIHTKFSGFMGSTCNSRIFSFQTSTPQL